LLIVPLTNKQTTWQKKLAQLVPQVPTHTPTRTKRTALLAALKAFEEGVFLVHFEGYCSIAKQLRRRDWDLIIVDEAHRAKDRNSLFSRRLAFLRDHCARKIILTGTPIDEEPQDLWAQFRFLAVEVFGDRWKDFDEEYMEQPPEFDFNKFGRGSVRLKRALMKHRILKSRLGFDWSKFDQFISKIKDYCWFEELPGAKPNFHVIKTKMYGYQRRVYDDLKTRGVVHLKDGARIKPDNEAVKRVKLLQITSGFLYDEEKEVHWIGRAKLRELLILLRKVKLPVPVFCLYRPEIEELEKILPGRVGVLSGKVKGEDRVKVQERFQAGKLDYLLCQTRTAGVGIDLYRAKSLVVLSSNQSSIDFDQLISRIRLPDQTEPVDIYLILVQETVDEDRQVDVFGKNRRVLKAMSQLRRVE
jgi:superfamily II DNA or RNA helicase